MSPDSTLDDVGAALAKYRNLQDCILTDVRWLNWGSSLECHFNYIWADDEGAVLPESEFRHIVIRFDGVQEMRLVGGLTDTMIRYPEEINWGLGEIALARRETARTQPDGGLTLYHIAFLWEGERRLDVVAARVAVEEQG